MCVSPALSQPKPQTSSSLVEAVTDGNPWLDVHRKKNQAPGQKTRRYKRDIDQIHDDLKDNGVLKMTDTLRNKDIEDLPGQPPPSRSSISSLLIRVSNPTGMAQHGCLPCSRYFSDAVALATHLTEKPHKRQLKKLKEDPYTRAESLAAVNKGVDNGESARRKAEREKGMQVEPVVDDAAAPVAATTA